MENKYLPAFPTQNSDRGIEKGLTKREYFAGLAMQSMLSCGYSEFNTTNEKRIAEIAISQADELLKQLNNGK